MKIDEIRCEINDFNFTIVVTVGLSSGIPHSPEEVVVADVASLKCN